MCHLDMSSVHSPAAPSKLSPETSLSAHCHPHLDDLSTQYKWNSGCLFGIFLNQEIHFGNLIYTNTPTGAKQHYSLQVGIFVTVGLQPRHAVTELLELPNMLHHLLDFLSR